MPVCFQSRNPQTVTNQEPLLREEIVYFVFFFIDFFAPFELFFLVNNTFLIRTHISYDTIISLS